MPNKKIKLSVTESLTIRETKQIASDLRDMIAQNDFVYYRNVDNFDAMDYEKFFWAFHNRVKDTYEV